MEGREGRKGKSQKEEEREGESGTEGARGRDSYAGWARFGYSCRGPQLMGPVCLLSQSQFTPVTRSLTQPLYSRGRPTVKPKRTVFQTLPSLDIQTRRSSAVLAANRNTRPAFFVVASSNANSILKHNFSANMTEKKTKQKMPHGRFIHSLSSIYQ